MGANSAELCHQHCKHALAEALQQLNPNFGLIHDGCWPASVSPFDAACQRAQRRELEQGGSCR
jgi:hypothetical protein